MKTYPGVEITGDARITLPDRCSRLNPRAMGRLAAAVRRCAMAQFTAHAALWLFAMRVSGAPEFEILAAAAAADSLRASLYTMRTERLIAEYGYLLPAAMNHDFGIERNVAPAPLD